MSKQSVDKSGRKKTFEFSPIDEMASVPERLLKPKEAAAVLRLSVSWLAKARMHGNGPDYIKPGRAVRYQESALLHWVKSRARRSTREGR